MRDWECGVNNNPLRLMSSRACDEIAGRSGWGRNRGQVPLLHSEALTEQAGRGPDAGWRRGDGRLCYAAGATKEGVWRRDLLHRHDLIQGEVPVRKGVPAGGDIAAAGGSRWAVARRLSLGRRLLFSRLGD